MSGALSGAKAAVLGGVATLSGASRRLLGRRANGGARGDGGCETAESAADWRNPVKFKSFDDNLATACKRLRPERQLARFEE